MNSDNNNCDVVIMTIVVLAKLYSTCEQYETAGVHVNTLRRIVALRGGYSSLGWNGYVGLKARQ
jgi:hypothetical protein